ncbi:hypothetical protein HW40_07710 [Mannheimia haemolytica]|uniref:zincin-like metallopeptidase domain-containing protein n=1 Tax=Mannheimia haemolytica TaxID=75985 RepID=UPI0005C9420E|nr:zincin-like metallopeptidase domain-containing protein [Mannheimia haemolytica]KIX30667.1 hypothetical protein HW40_07710 [Mannheimia haemolytica]
MADKKNVRVNYEDQLADVLRNAIINNDSKWEKRWNSFDFYPQNGNTGRPYSGINELKLYFLPYSDPRWFTYKQIKELGGKVKKGEKGRLIQFYTNKIERIKKDKNGNPIIDNDGNKKREVEVIDGYIAKYYIVFNAEQTIGLPPYTPPEITAEDRKKRDLYNIERIEQLVRNMNINVEEKFSNKAYYQPDLDLIVIPDKAQFKGKKEYYGTLLHETSHATSHPSRLNRKLSFDMNTKEYAKEELIAEISSMLLSRKYQIAVQNPKRDFSDEKNSLAYLRGWILAGKITNDDFKDAIKIAVKVSNYITLHDKELNPDKSLTKNDEQRKQQIIAFAQSKESKLCEFAKLDSVEKYHKFKTQLIPKKEQVRDLER